MKKYFVIIFLMLLEVGYTWSLQSVTLADTPLAKELTISQIKITGDEFIVLRNATNANLSLSSYWLQYFNDFDLARTSSASSAQLPAVGLQPGQEILLTVGTAAACGPVWVSKLAFNLKDSAGMLQIVGISQSGGIVGYKPHDQISWSSSSNPQSNYSVDIEGVSSASSIYYKTDTGWQSTTTPPGCTAATSSTSPVTNTPDTLSRSNSSPPHVLLSESAEGSSQSKIPAADIGLMAPQLSEILANPASPKTDANDEYIELYNPNDKPFDLSGFKLLVGVNTTYSYTFPSGQFNLQPYEFKAFYSSTTNLPLSNSSSKVQFLSPDGDVLAASDAYSDVQDDYAWILADGLWQWTNAPTPNARNVINASSTSSSLSNRAVGPAATTTTQNYPTLAISELLPNPKSPQTDAEDEFIEIYNPNKGAIDLTGYVIVTGSKDNYKYTIKNGTITPGAYKAFYSSETNLTLGNNGGRAKLLAPNGSQIDVTADYPAAPDGQSWIYADGKWQWTTTPTPGKANIFVASTTSTNTAGARSSATNKSPVGAAGGAGSTNRLHPLILAGVGTAVLLYALYEYRHDVANQVYRLRRNRAARRASGAVTPTPGGHRAAL